jgi:hypothetical protein
MSARHLVEFSPMSAALARPVGHRAPGWVPGRQVRPTSLARNRSVCLARGGVGAQAATGPANPYAPSYQHPYRHGAVPTRAAQAKMNAYRAQHPLVQAAATQNLHYGGGVDGIGITTGPPKVYLVFWGSGWGSSSTNQEGDLDFTPVNSRRPTSRSRFATADPLGRVRESHPGAVRAANGTRACRRSHPPVPGPPHARP